MLAVWDDTATLGHALDFEAALAGAQADAGMIPASAAEAVAAACLRLKHEINPAALADEAALAGTLAIPLVRRLRQASGEEHAAYAHLGATSQDLAETALACQLRDSAALLLTDADRILAALAPLARAHAATPAMGRTLLQDALPIALGLRIAQWHAGIADARRMLDEAASRGAVLQLGGAVGSRKGTGDVAAEVARRLALADAAPWHARRTGTAGIAAALGVLIGATGKFARDVSLLAQQGIGEMREPAVAGRGGSSAMAHKRNPTACQVALAAAVRSPGLVAGVLAAMPAEQERGLGGWQAEGPMLADLCLLASGALEAMASVAEGLEIDLDAVSANLPQGEEHDLGQSARIIEDLLKE